MPESKYIKAYMIYDPKESKWYRVNAFGFVAWSDQQVGAVWTSKQEAEKLLAHMSGSRARRCEIKPFLLVPISR